MATASVKVLMPASSSQRSWSVVGPSRATKPQRAQDHVGDRDVVQRGTVVQHRGQQHRKRRLVELDALPERIAAEPLVLEPVAVLLLGGDEIAQHVARAVVGFHGDEGAGGLDQVARPDEMIAAAAFAGVAPRHRQARHRCAAIGAVLVHLQHRRRQRQHGVDVGADGRAVALGEPRFPGAALRIPFGSKNRP